MNELDNLLKNISLPYEEEFVKLYAILIGQINSFDSIQKEIYYLPIKLEKIFGGLKPPIVMAIINMFKYEFACSIRRMLEFLIDCDYRDKWIAKYKFNKLDILRKRFGIETYYTDGGKLKFVKNESIRKLMCLKLLLEKEWIHYHQSDFKMFNKFSDDYKISDDYKTTYIPEWNIDYLYSEFANVIFDLDAFRNVTEGYIKNNETIVFPTTPLMNLFGIDYERDLSKEFPFYPFRDMKRIDKQLEIMHHPILRKWKLF